MSLEITRDAAGMLYTLYDQYKLKRKNGADTFSARMMGGADQIQRTCMEMASESDIADWCFELQGIGFMTVQPGDDTVVESCLTTASIAYMENRLKSGVKSLAEFVAAAVK